MGDLSTLPAPALRQTPGELPRLCQSTWDPQVPHKAPGRVSSPAPEASLTIAFPSASTPRGGSSKSPSNGSCLPTALAGFNRPPGKNLLRATLHRTAHVGIAVTNSIPHRKLPDPMPCPQGTIPFLKHPWPQLEQVYKQALLMLP